MTKNLAFHNLKTIFKSKRPITAPLVEGFCGAIGNTPLISLPSLNALTGCNILGKAEFMNPGGSVKDRAALWMIQDVENKGLLKPGGTVVEGTAGNTGIGLAHICRSRGYSCVIYMPDNQSEEKVASLKFLSEVHQVPVVPFTDPNNYNHQAARYAQRTENCIWTNQFDNLANTQAHYESTAPELLQQTGNKIDAFVCSTGTGGTLSGIALYFEKHSPKTKIILADPPGSVLYNKIMFGRLERQGLNSITEGIGQGRITQNVQACYDLIHSAIHIPDEETIHILFRLIHDEGLPLGASSALNVAAAVQVAKQLGPGHTVVTILCDLAYRYAKRLFHKPWLESKQLLESVPKDCLKYLDTF